MKTIVFQGDSVTDVGRSRESDNWLGSGYPTVISAILGATYPGEYNFINRAISGNRSVDVYARIKKDILNVEPDVVSVLMGINDVWHELSHQNGIGAEKFYRIYDMLLEEVKAARPEAKLMLLEPFVLPGEATQEHWDYFEKETALRAQAVEALAKKYDATFIPLQKKLEEASKQTGFAYWLRDGVHPTVNGHGLIAESWLEAFKALS